MYLLPEQQLAMSANSRVKELQNELTAERTKLVSLEKQFQDRLAKQQAENEAFQTKLHHSHEQHMREVAEMRTRLQQAEQSSNADLVQKLKQVG